jgi:hypothetical protein
MKLAKIIIVALGLSLSGGALAGTALADPGRNHDHRGERWRDNDRGDRHRDHDRGRHDNRWDRWGHQVPVGFFNAKNRPVTLYMNGRYLGRIAPNSFERISLPTGYHTVSYQVGRRGHYQQLSVSAFYGQRNRVVIPGRGGWNRW